MPAGYDNPGPKPDNILPAIVGKLRTTLRDPSSVRDFVLCEPQVSKPFKYPGNGNQWERAHWTVYFALNAKNAYGGYTGPRAYTAKYENGTLSDVYSPNMGRELDAKMLELTRGCPHISETVVQEMLEAAL